MTQIIHDLENIEHPHSLSAWTRKEDERLDAARDAQLANIDAIHELARGAPDDVFLRDGIMGPMLSWAVEQARGVTDVARASKRLATAKRAATRDTTARWRDEVEALHAWWNAHAVTRDGATGATLARIKLGASIQTSARPVEPKGDAHLRAVGILLGRGFTAMELKVLVLTLVELAPPRTVYNSDDDPVRSIVTGSAQTVATAMRANATRSRDDATDDRAGNVDCPEGVATSEVRASHLVAAALGMEAEAVEAQAKALKKRLRDGLRAIEIDVKPSLLIPALSHREQRIEATEGAPLVESCVGGPMVEGVRWPCEVQMAPAIDVEACASCGTCGRPRASGRVA